MYVIEDNTHENVPTYVFNSTGLEATADDEDSPLTGSQEIQ